MKWNQGLLILALLVGFSVPASARVVYDNDTEH